MTDTKFNDTSFDEILEASCEERFEFFLAMVADAREVWILINEQKEFLKIHSPDDGIEYLPVFPHAYFAQEYSKTSQEKLTAKSIPLPEFLAKWVSGMERDGLDVGVFPISGSDVWLMEAAELKADIQAELSNFNF